MNKTTLLIRALKLGLINLFRNKLLSLTTIIVIAIMLCIFNSILTVNQIVRDSLTAVNQKIDLIVYLVDNINFYDAITLRDTLQKQPGVKKVEYISKNDALNLIAKTYPETAAFFQKYKIQNPLPASLRIKVEQPEVHEKIQLFLTRPENRNKIQFTPDNRLGQTQITSGLAENLISINNFIRQLTFWIVFIFIIGGALIIFNAIQLAVFNRRNEIEIMQLVGAPNWFIRLPFLTEGILIGIFAVALNFLLLASLDQIFSYNNFNFSSLLQNKQFTKILLTEFFITASIGLISSLLTVEQHLKTLFRNN